MDDEKHEMKITLKFGDHYESVEQFQGKGKKQCGAALKRFENRKNMLRRRRIKYAYIFGASENPLIYYKSNYAN